jgi:hypothetical protein
MKSKILFVVFYAILILSQVTIAQDDVTVIVPTTEAGENLDLEAVMELFGEAESLEDFEKALNDSSSEVNNLDLNEDGEVDYIRVVEQVDGDVHIVILQVPLAENEYQDVATINIEKNGDDYVVQAQGDPDLYGEDYYVEPEPETEVKTTTVVIMFGVGYSPWISPWYWRVYPVWWRPWRPHPISVYRSLVVRHHRAHYRHSRHRRTVRAHNHYKSHRKTSNFAKQKKKKNTYTTQPVKQDPKKKEQTKKKNQTKKKQPTKKKTGTKKKR